MKTKIKLCKDCKFCEPTKLKFRSKETNLIYSKCTHPLLKRNPPLPKQDPVTGFIDKYKYKDVHNYCSFNRSSLGGGGKWIFKWGCGPLGNLYEAKDERTEQLADYLYKEHIEPHQLPLRCCPKCGGNHSNSSPNGGCMNCGEDNVWPEKARDFEEPNEN